MGEWIFIKHDDKTLFEILSSTDFKYESVLKLMIMIATPPQFGEEVQAPPPLSSYEKFRPGVSETFWTLYLSLGTKMPR